MNVLRVVLISAPLRQKNMAIRYKCGAEFLPSPMASKAEFALTAEPPLVRKGHMSAVAVAVEMGHAVAFVGTATGEVNEFDISQIDILFTFSPLNLSPTTQNSQRPIS